MYSIFEEKLQNCSPNQLNKYLYNDESEIKVNINNSGGTLKKETSRLKSLLLL